MTTSRREFLRRTSFAVVPVLLTRQEPIPAQGKQGGAVAADTLAFPAGRAAAPLGPLDNDPGVIAIERQLGCACGCTLDVYTCRTTDFSCGVSPAMHATVVAKVQRGDSADAILQWFLEQPDSAFGTHKVRLMAPPAQGFNLMGYLVPGLTVTAVGLVLAAWILRRRTAADVPELAAASAAAPAPDSAQLDRLKRALDDIES